MNHTATDRERYIEKYHNDVMFHRITETMGAWLFLRTLTEDDLTWAAKMAIEIYHREVQDTVAVVEEIQARWDAKNAKVRVK